MKTSKLINKVEEYLGADNRKRKEKIKYLKQALKKLRKRERELEDRFEADEGNKEKISNELALIHAHRKKGLKLLKQLEKERASSKKTKKINEIKKQAEFTAKKQGGQTALPKRHRT